MGIVRFWIFWLCTFFFQCLSFCCFFVSLTWSGFRLGEVYLHPSLGWSFCFCWSNCITRWVNEWTPRWLFHMFLGRICSSQFFVVEEMSFCWGQTILKVAGSTTVLKIWQKLSKLIGLAPITRAIFPAAAWDSVFDLAFLRLGLLEFWGVGLSGWPCLGLFERRWPFSGTSWLFSKWTFTTCILKSAIAVEMHISLVFFVGGNTF